MCCVYVLFFSSIPLAFPWLFPFPTWTWDIEMPDLEEGNKAESKERKQAGRLAASTQERSFHKLRDQRAEQRFEPFLHIEANASD